MLPNGIKFIGVVAAPGFQAPPLPEGPDSSLPATINAWLDLISQGDYEISDTMREEAHHAALEILKAKFSCIDHERVIPMRDEELPDDIWSDAEYGFGFYPHKPFPHGLSLADPDMMYELFPKLVSLNEIDALLPFAKKHGHHSGLALDELEKAQQALLIAHAQMISGSKNFRSFEPVRSLVLSGAQIKAGVREDRDDITLNILFDREQGFRRLAQLTVPAP